MNSEKHAMTVSPGRAVGLITLGVCLHDILTRLKAHPSLYPSIDLSYSSTDPVDAPIVVNLPHNGLRLRFDGPDQRLRVVEVTDFHRTKLVYRDEEIFKEADQSSGAFMPPGVTGPSCRHIYKLFGPAQPGEYIAPKGAIDGSSRGTYVLSYPGIAFTFPLLHSAWSHGTDSAKTAGLLMSSAAGPALSMALFSGHSWPDVRPTLFTSEPPNPRAAFLSHRGKEIRPAEVDLVKIYGEGRLELVRRGADPFWIVLGQTTPQDLLAELGPPDAIYKKSDRRSEIHKEEGVSVRSNSISPARRADDSSDSDFASHPDTDTSEAEDDQILDVNRQELESAEVFYNYFSHGFDILVSQPANPSPAWPSELIRLRQDESRGQEDGDYDTTNRGSRGNNRPKPAVRSQNRLTATKIILHGNIPGSYTFNRHRRSRWVLSDLPTAQQRRATTSSPTSEWHFSDIRARLEPVFAGSYASESERRIQQEPMSVHREVGDSPSSSCEIVGGVMEGVSESRGSGIVGAGAGSVAGGSRVLGNTLIYPFPGMLFDVLKNDAVSALTIF